MFVNLSKEFSRVSCFITDKPVLTEHSFYDPTAKPLVWHCQSKYLTDCEGYRNCRCFRDILHKIRPSYSDATIQCPFDTIIYSYSSPRIILALQSMHTEWARNGNEQ